MNGNFKKVVCQHLNTVNRKSEPYFEDETRSLKIIALHEKGREKV